ncbi:MAG: hypothetical protein CMB22_02445 [Euryarchaeota archaeon]|nr:hypothetical protein [Euryarchaeota archaeon]
MCLASDAVAIQKAWMGALSVLVALLEIQPSRHPKIVRNQDRFLQGFGIEFSWFFDDWACSWVAFPWFALRPRRLDYPRADSFTASRLDVERNLDR